MQIGWSASRRVQRAFVSALLSSALAADAVADGVPREVVAFQHSYLTTFGDSVYVLGDIPELGAGDIRRAVKLLPGTVQGGTLPWTLDVAIPQGTSFSYRFVLRNDDVNRMRDPNNGSFLTAPTAGATTPPTPLKRNVTVLGYPADGATQATFFTSSGNVNVPLAPHPERPDLLRATLPWQPNGRGIDGSIGGVAIDTPLHTILRRGTGLYNYEPAGAFGETGTIETFVIQTSTVPSTRTVNGVTGRGVRIFLPRGYAANATWRYPVLYMHDGQNVFRPGGPFGCWFAEDVANLLIRQAKIRELLIVAVDNSPQRGPEYVPELGNATVDNGDYNSFLINELKPYVDSHYRTLTDAASTAVIGSSYGGVASLILALDHASVFGQVGAMSTAFWQGNTQARVSAGQIPAAVRVYLDSGDTNDDEERTQAVRDALIVDDRVLYNDLLYYVGFNQQHNEAAWNARLPVALQFLFPISDEPNALDPLSRTPGDADGDGRVGQDDLDLVLFWFGLGPGGDVNGDGQTDQDDLDEVLFNFGVGCP